VERERGQEPDLSDWEREDLASEGICGHPIEEAFGFRPSGLPWYNGLMRGSAMRTESQVRASEAAILSRLLANGTNGMSPVVARHILALGFDDEDKTRMHELAVKNQEGKLSPEERRELENYVKVGDLLTILKAKVRSALKKSSR
jgi:hypothetical protein